MWFAILLSLVVVAYNNVVNRWEPFHGSAYVPLNLAFTGAVSLVVAVALGLTRSQIGLEGDVMDASIALAPVAVFGVGAFVLVRSRFAHRIADKRVAGLRGDDLAYHVLARIPLGTAVAEEILFRGVLFAVWRNTSLSILGAALCASLAFGLWHISPTVIGIRMNDPEASPRKLWIAVIGAVVLTTIAGLGLSWVRLRTGGLVAPIVLHAGINSIGALAAVAAGRR